MNRDEILSLLAYAAARDNREPSDAKADAWLVDLGDIPFDLAIAAVNHHFRTSDKYLMPVHVRDCAREIAQQQRERAESISRREDLERRALEAGPAPAELMAAITEQVKKWATPEAARERALIVARRMKGRPDTSAKPKQRNTNQQIEYPAPSDEVAKLAIQYLVAGYTPAQVSERLGISKRWCQKTARRFISRED